MDDLLDLLIDPPEVHPSEPEVHHLDLEVSKSLLVLDIQTCTNPFLLLVQRYTNHFLAVLLPDDTEGHLRSNYLFQPRFGNLD